MNTPKTARVEQVITDTFADGDLVRFRVTAGTLSEKLAWRQGTIVKTHHHSELGHHGLDRHPRYDVDLAFENEIILGVHPSHLQPSAGDHDRKARP